MPNRSVLIGQKLKENAKIQKFKCDILSNFQTMWAWFFVPLFPRWALRWWWCSWSKLSLFLPTLFEKSKFCPKIQFWQKPNIFASFSPNFFFDNFFSWNQSCQQLKSPKPQHFHKFFTPKKIDNFLGKSKLNFWTKNEDFEQCVGPIFWDENSDYFFP